MSFFEKVKRYVKNPTRLIIRLGRHSFLKNMSDEKYLKLLFKDRMGYPLNLDNPQTFNEKLQWLKIYNRRPEYTAMVDKYEAKLYVADKIGEEYIIPTLGVWEKFEDIDFDALPDRFVLKCTHDSGGLVICRDKSKLDKEAAKKKIERSLKRNYYWASREWPYKDVKPRIIAERFLETGEEGLIDYKFYCFNGKPEFLYISRGLENHATASISFVTMDWEFAPYGRNDYKPFLKLPAKPSNFEEMVTIAKKMSVGVDFLRVDLYSINNRIYFSELTFFPCSGYMPFSNPEHDLEVGNMLTLTSLLEEKNEK